MRLCLLGGSDSSGRLDTGLRRALFCVTGGKDHRVDHPLDEDIVECSVEHELVMNADGGQQRHHEIQIDPVRDFTAVADILENPPPTPGEVPRRFHGTPLRVPRHCAERS